MATQRAGSGVKETLIFVYFLFALILNADFDSAMCYLFNEVGSQECLMSMCVLNCSYAVELCMNYTGLNVPSQIGKSILWLLCSLG